MGYEARMDAASEYASEVAYEMFMNGDLDEEIKKQILEGFFDETIIERIKILVKQK